MPLCSANEKLMATGSQATTTRVVPFGATSVGSSSTLYEDCLAAPLPTIDIHKTLLAKLCCREHDAAFNTAVIAFTRRVEPAVYGAVVLQVAASLSLFFIADLRLRTLATCVGVACGLVSCVHAAASLLWDVLCLVVRTFDFWFLTGMNAVNTVLWCLLFHDIRAAVMTTIGIVLNMAMAVDANVYTRRLSVRLYVLGPPAIFTSLVFVFAQFPPDLHYTTYHVRGVAVNSVDLMANANFTVIFFMLVRGLRSWRLIISRGPVESVRCGLFLPSCHLAPQPQPLSQLTPTRSELEAPSPVSSSAPSTVGCMLLEERAIGKAIDITQTLLPTLARVTPTLASVWILNKLAVVGCIFTTAAIVREVVTSDSATGKTGKTSAGLAIIGFAASVLFVVVHTAHFQPRLAKRVLLEVDAWYISFQITSTTVTACDIVDWQKASVFLFLTPWLWCHWMIFLDALPGITRRRLGCSRRLIVVVTILLMLYPVLLGYYVYYTPARPFLRNRVLLRMTFGETVMRVETFGFLASKLFMFSVWTARSLWRELSRPADAFKIIKLSAYYLVGNE